MKMKKIISALIVGATAAGIATADLTLSVGSKLAGYAFQYNTGNAEGFKGTKQKALFNLSGYDGTGSDLKLTAKGNVFTFFTQVGVASENLDNQVKAMTITANVGNFQATTGWIRAGIANMSTSDPAKGDDKGAVTGETYKLGSPFGTALAHSNTQSGFGKDADNYFAHAKYGFGLGDAVKLNLAAAVMSPHGVNNSQKREDDNVVGNGGNSKRVDNSQMGWGVNVNPVIGKIVSVDLFAKGFGQKQGVDGHNFLLGAYAKLLCVPILSNAVFGGSVWLLADDYKATNVLQEWNVDLDFAFAIGDRFKLGFNNKFAFKENGANGSGDTPGAATAIGLASNKPKGEFLLWDVLSASFKLSDTLTILGSVGQQTAFGDDDGQIAKGSAFTQLYVYPRVQMFATSKASVTAGMVATFDGLGKGEGHKMIFLLNVPFVVKVSL